MLFILHLLNAFIACLEKSMDKSNDKHNESRYTYKTAQV